MYTAGWAVKRCNAIFLSLNDNKHATNHMYWMTAFRTEGTDSSGGCYACTGEEPGKTVGAKSKNWDSHRPANQSQATDAPNRNQFGPNNSNLWSHLALFSHPMNGLYHNVSPCHFSDRIHVSLITYSQIYFWSGNGLPGPPFCDESDLESYTVLLCSPVGRFPHHCVCLGGFRTTVFV